MLCIYNTSPSPSLTLLPLPPTSTTYPPSLPPSSPSLCPAGCHDVIVALGKFDALHLGHQSLASRAACMGGQPCLLSFSGMAEVLGWPIRQPLVAACDRPRVLNSWEAACHGR